MYDQYQKEVFYIMESIGISDILAKKILGHILSKPKRIHYRHFLKLNIDPDYLIEQVSKPEKFKSLILQTTSPDLSNFAQNFILDILTSVLENKTVLEGFFDQILEWAPSFFNFPKFLASKSFSPLIIRYLKESLFVKPTSFSQNKWISQIIVQIMKSDCSEILTFFQEELKPLKKTPTPERIQGALDFAENILEIRTLLPEQDEMKESLLYECVNHICNQCFQEKKRRVAMLGCSATPVSENSSQDLLAHFIKIMIRVISQNFETNKIQSKRLNEMEERIKELEGKKN